MKDGPPTVHVIDDDQSVREALHGLLETAALRVELFSSPQQYLEREPKTRPNCIILDVRLPGSSGLDFQKALADAGVYTPIIFLTGYADIPMTVQAMKAGAVEFLTKPYRDQALLEAVLLAIDKDVARRKSDNAIADFLQRFESLTARERQVMALIVAGQQNKQIAGQLRVQDVTVRLHRRQMMQKMQAKSVADLTRIADILRSTDVNLSPL
jgi:FixJ family two-component response regulator